MILVMYSAVTAGEQNHNQFVLVYFFYWVVYGTIFVHVGSFAFASPARTALPAEKYHSTSQ